MGEKKSRYKVKKIARRVHKLLEPLSDDDLLAIAAQEKEKAAAAAQERSGSELAEQGAPPGAGGVGESAQGENAHDALNVVGCALDAPEREGATREVKREAEATGGAADDGGKAIYDAARVKSEPGGEDPVNPTP